MRQIKQDTDLKIKVIGMYEEYRTVFVEYIKSAFRGPGFIGGRGLLGAGPDRYRGGPGLDRGYIGPHLA